LAQLFPEWSNRLPLLLVVGLIATVVAVIGGVWYYGSPWYTDVGYEPTQPVPYSHTMHAGRLGLDCRYCHVGVEQAAVAMVPPTQTCMNCHTMIKTQSPKLAQVRESWETGVPIKWVRVHKIPDYAYFDHSMHLRAGVGCESCHGNVRMMDVVRQVEPLSMGWCLDCHRNPDQHLRPQSEVTTMGWVPPADQAAFARKVKAELKLNPPVTCSGCHR
jgi:hypothetical protein